MTEMIYDICIKILKEKHGELPEEEMNNFADDLYDRFVQRILVKTTELVEGDKLEKMAPLLDTAEDDELLEEIAKHTDMESLINDTEKEIKEAYLRSI